jgi:(S)-ureidoglycine aminohydrolase
MIFGETRTKVAHRHALIAPDGHVPSVLPGISGAVTNVIISPAMGANLTQLLITFAKDGRAEFGADDLETCVFIMEGGCVATIDSASEPLGKGGYVFAPAGKKLELSRAAEGTKITVFQKYFEEIEGIPGPAPVFGNEKDVEGQPFLGDPDAILKVLLPDTPSFDMAVNLFTYKAGARLPFVETHIMEHGLMMLEGEGVYRLEDSWYPVTAGDAIWMAPYCPQWFVAMGKGPASYLYYKDINRSPMA